MTFEWTIRIIEIFIFTTPIKYAICKYYFVFCFVFVFPVLFSAFDFVFERQQLMVYIIYGGGFAKNKNIIICDD